MYSDDDNFSTSISELCSHKEKPSDFQQENNRLRKQRGKLMEMNAQLSKELEAAKKQLLKKDEDIQKLDQYYCRVIKDIKSQMVQNTKHCCRRGSLKGVENSNPNIGQTKDQNKFKKQKKNKSTCEETSENMVYEKSIFWRACTLKNSLTELSIEEACDKCNSLILELKQKNVFEGNQNFTRLKGMISCLRDTPLSINLLSQKDIQQVEMAMIALDTQLGLLKTSY